MKLTVITLMTLSLLSHPFAGTTKSTGGSGDTVVIEINNRSKIMIYTEDRVELKNLEQYDLNGMIKDLNSALGSKKIQKIELEDENGKKYLKDTTIVIGDGQAKTRIKIGNMELLVDVDDWDDLEDEFEDDDLEIKRYSYEEKSVDRTRHDFNIDFGLNNWMEGSQFPDANGALHSVKPWGSWYFALNSVQRTWVAGPLFLDWGLGVSWYNWKMQDADVAISKGDDRVEFAKLPGITGIKSRLQVPYVNVTMVPMLDFGRGSKKVRNIERGSLNFRTYKKQGLRVGVGGYAGYRLGGNTKFIYREDGNREKDKTAGNFYVNNFRYGIRAQVGFKGLDIFAMYDMNEVFAPNRGPAGSNGLNALTFGITL